MTVTGAHDGETPETAACRPAHRRSASRTHRPQGRRGLPLRQVRLRRHQRPRHRRRRRRRRRPRLPLLRLEGSTVQRRRGHRQDVRTAAARTGRGDPRLVLRTAAGTAQRRRLPHPVLTVLRSSGRDEGRRPAAGGLHGGLHQTPRRPPHRTRRRPARRTPGGLDARHQPDAHRDTPPGPGRRTGRHTGTLPARRHRDPARPITPARRADHRTGDPHHTPDDR